MKFKDSWFAGPSKELAEYFYRVYFLPLLEIVNPKKVTNAAGELFGQPKKSALQIALDSGRVQYSKGVFSGKFNIAVSNELALFATFDGRSNSWKAFKMIPPEIRISIAQNIRWAETVNSEMKRKVEELSTQALARVDSLTFNIEKPVTEMLSMAKKDVLESIAVAPDFTPEQWESIKSAFDERMVSNITNWHDTQITRLREMISQNMVEGMNRTAIMQHLMDEYGVTENKARFLARQETTLLSSFIQEERYTAAGVKYYIWDAVGDNRTVGKPDGLYPKPTKGHGNHFALNGTVCRMDDPSIYAESIADAKAGVWKTKRSIGAHETHPGEEYLCRCTRRPLTSL
jgi:SPP1 gp7 family putative phage head morphogenesis protein